LKYQTGVNPQVILIVGLGNPGEKYSSTRHNIGFMVTGRLSEKYSITGKFEPKFNAIIGKENINGTPVIVAQPMTYMNLSGDSISKILGFYKIPVENLMVVYDDIALDLGRIRFRKEGSDGGHNGIKSTIQCLGNKNTFPRLKVGIGPQPKGIPSETYVLKSFAKTEKEILDKVIDISIESLECFVKEGVDVAQNKYNGTNLSGDK
jgi:PTH1 family peptidyl-tRNA hydrolase